jgi:hypothetical protein
VRQTSQIKKDLTSTFNHEQINVSYNTSTDKGSFLIVTLFEYPLGDKTNAELRNLATQAEQTIYVKSPSMKTIDYILVRFTSEVEDEDSESLGSFVEFKLE